MTTENNQLVLIVGYSSTGKAQPLHCEIKSPIEDLTFENVQIGDPIFGEDGKVYQVIDVMEQGNLDSYRITFNDGTSTECAKEHLWTYHRRKKHLPNKEGTYTAELQDLMNMRPEVLYFKTCEPVPKDKQDFLISPELMGYIISEGYIAGKSICISMAESEMIEKLLSIKLCDNYEFVKSRGNNFNYVLKYVSFSGSKYDRNIYIEELQRLGLWGKKSGDKFIPSKYLNGSILQRIELLQALVNCDGSVSTKSDNPDHGSTVTYSTTSEKLAHNIVELCNSLGLTATIGLDNRDNYTSGTCYTLVIHVTPDRVLPFTSTKHTTKYVEPSRYRWSRRYIKSIEYVGKTRMRCISTSNPTGLYLTDHYIVTHNSASLRNIKNQDKWLYLCSESGKRLPFKNNFDTYNLTDPLQVYEAFDHGTDNDKVYGIIIDSLTFLMDMFEAQYIYEAADTRKAWGDYAAFFREIMLTKVPLFGKPTILTAHVRDEVDQKSMDMKTFVPIKGNTRNVGVEAYFSTIVASKKLPLKELEAYENDLLTITPQEEALGFKYVFQTQLTKQTTGERIRSPMDMFTPEETFINNDVTLLLNRLNDFYS